MVTPVGMGTIRATYHLLEMHNTVKDIIHFPWLLANWNKYVLYLVAFILPYRFYFLVQVNPKGSIHYN